jgi:calcineurin-like phosphoesterase family protein
MTHNKFVISDTHFGHENACTKFKRKDGSPLRPFANAEEMDEAMVERWNSRVSPHDTVYHLGDVVINKKFLPILHRLNGKKKLIMGNHDIFGIDEYRKYFYEVAAYRVFVDDFVFSHIPLHPECVSERFKVNVHGHLHSNKVMLTERMADPRYLCVCVEHTDYAPISFDEVKQRIKDYT